MPIRAQPDSLRDRYRHVRLVVNDEWTNEDAMRQLLKESFEMGVEELVAKWKEKQCS
jgi:hypothetical protein